MIAPNSDNAETTVIPIDQLKLPTISNECMQILDMLSDKDVDITNITRIISTDALLSATVIKYANSPLYRRSQSITSIGLAVSLLGIKNVTAAVMMATMKAFSTNKTLVDSTVWEHNLAISTLCKVVANHTYPETADEMELIGLLHDMGALILSANYGEAYLDLYKQSSDHGIPLDELETSTFGYNRDDVMLKIADEFRLPEDIKRIVCHFHSSDPVTDLDSINNQHTLILSLAHYIESMRKDKPHNMLETVVDYTTQKPNLLNYSNEELAALAENCETFIEGRMSI